MVNLDSVKYYLQTHRHTHTQSSTMCGEKRKRFDCSLTHSLPGLLFRTSHVIKATGDQHLDSELFTVSFVMLPQMQMFCMQLFITVERMAPLEHSKRHAYLQESCSSAPTDMRRCCDCASFRTVSFYTFFSLLSACWLHFRGNEMPLVVFKE